MNTTINFKKSILVILSIFILAAFVSASSAPTIINLDKPTSGVDTGATFNVMLNINNNLAVNLTNLVLSYTDLKANPFARLASVQVGSQTFSVSPDSSSANSIVYGANLQGLVIPNNTVSDDVILTFVVDSKALAESFSRTIILSGNSISSLSNSSFTVTVNPNPQISITTMRQISANQSALVNITNTGNSLLDSVTLSGSGGFTVSFNPSSSFALSSKESRTVEVSSSDLANIKFGVYASTITANTTNGVSAQTQLSLQKDFCRSGQVGGNLSIYSVKVSSDGTDDSEWFPLTQVTVTVGVENVGPDSVGNIYVDMGLFDSNGRNVVKDLNFQSSDEDAVKLGRINENKDAKATFEFTVPADFKADSYKLTFKTYSKDSGLGEDRLCADTSSDLANNLYQAISVDQQTDTGKSIAFDKIFLNPTEATCGSAVVLNFDTINVGEDNQDQVKVDLISSELGISMSNEIKTNLDSGDSQTGSFTFNVPANAATKTYNLMLTAEYDYRNSGYHQFSDRQTPVSLKVVCANSVAQQSGNTVITASLADNSAAKAGSKMTVNARITNMGTNSSSIIVSAKDYESWAVLDSISERLLVLSPGQSKDIQMEFTVNNDASGENSFTIDALSEGNTQSKNVIVDIAGSATDNASGLFSSLKGNSLVWVIGIVNLVLIILIIVIAFRVSRR